MRVGLLTTSFPTHETDISGHFVLGFAQALVKQGCTVDVLAPEPRTPTRPPTWPGIQLRHIPYVRPRRLATTFYNAGVPDNLRNPLAWLGPIPFAANAFGVARQMSSRWQAIVSHWAFPSALIAGFANPTLPHLTVFHSADLHLLRRFPWRSRIARQIAETSSAQLFVSLALRDWFFSLIDQPHRAALWPRSHVSPMGFHAGVPPAEARPELRKRWHLTRFTVLCMGRLVSIKAIDHAIEASVGAEWDLLIAGEGPERKHLELKAKRLGVRARFVGTVVDTAKQELLRASDAFVLPSKQTPSGRSEGMPTSILEAMSAGLPVIATRTGGIPDVLEHDVDGVLVPPSDPNALREAIARVATDAAFRTKLARCGKQKAARFEWDVLGPMLLRLIR